MKRFLLQIAYDGTVFAGWQKQKKNITVQSVLEDSIIQFMGQPVNLVGSSRTDSGVHARNQYAHFDCEKNMDCLQIKKAINSNLTKKDVIVKNVFEVDQLFHARYDAYARKYHYYITKEFCPFRKNYFAYLPHKKIDFKFINQATGFFIGKRDFSNFSKDNPDIPNKICDIKEIEFIEEKDLYLFTIKADRFLHNMVRRIIGTLIELSARNLDLGVVKDLLTEDKKKNNYIWTAPANGLFLEQVYYKKNFVKQKN